MSKCSNFCSMWDGWLGGNTKRTSCILPTLQCVNKGEFVESSVCERLGLGRSLSLSITSPSFGVTGQLL